MSGDEISKRITQEAARLESEVERGEIHQGIWNGLAPFLHADANLTVTWDEGAFAYEIRLSWREDGQIRGYNYYLHGEEITRYPLPAVTERIAKRLLSEYRKAFRLHPQWDNVYEWNANPWSTDTFRLYADGNPYPTTSANFTFTPAQTEYLARAVEDVNKRQRQVDPAEERRAIESIKDAMSQLTRRASRSDE